MALDDAAERLESKRPTLDAPAAAKEEATRAVSRFVSEMQAGFDHQDAEMSNRHFAQDVMWGSPFGATVHGYDQLHAIHVRLKEEGMGGRSSRYEVVDVLAPTPDVAIAQVRRVALDPDGEPSEPTSDLTGSFSEMALYVLVRHDHTWWLAAGQNTPLRRGPT